MFRQTKVRFNRSVRVRKNVRNLSAAELAELRRGYQLMYQLNNQNPPDYRSYCTWAGKHGIPDHYCPHGTITFLTWHRAYMYGMEITMGRLLGNPSFALPYWDWTSATSQQEGIPAAYTDPASNPLLSAVKCYNNTSTQRAPGAPSFLGILANRVSAAINNSTSFDEIWRGLESPHNSLHGWVGGDMGVINTAAYDPVFYAHHANVDRQWWQWQQLNPGVDPSNLDDPLPPFNMTVRDVLTTSQLDYTYAAAVVRAGIGKRSGAAAVLPTINKALGSFKVSDLESGKDFRKARIEMKNIVPTNKSFELRIFVNAPDADENTPVTDNDNFAGAVSFFGTGGCPGTSGHCRNPEPGDDLLIRSNHMTPFDHSVDVTSCISGICDKTDDLEFSFVAVDYQNNQVSLDQLELEDVALVLEE